MPETPRKHAGFDCFRQRATPSESCPRLGSLDMGRGGGPSSSKGPEPVQQMIVKWKYAVRQPTCPICSVAHVCESNEFNRAARLRPSEGSGDSHAQSPSWLAGPHVHYPTTLGKAAMRKQVCLCPTGSFAFRLSASLRSLHASRRSSSTPLAGASWDTGKQCTASENKMNMPRIGVVPWA